MFEHIFFLFKLSYKQEDRGVGKVGKRTGKIFHDLTNIWFLPKAVKRIANKPRLKTNVCDML